jgi:hypothetical protein
VEDVIAVQLLRPRVEVVGHIGLPMVERLV